ncbi:MAG: VTT domain-containing protein [Undibacterium sp.]|uniref:TVP38/TMEM64 family protein n=1 Tax=Undibacterium sp. TaxID=1914977 RepID=UPI00271D7F33|nr:VTT domain-containing protein [Undibacterium sp.]MDO8651546.1 VTT domain-containing protein [Undibacterium sp.]
MISTPYSTKSKSSGRWIVAACLFSLMLTGLILARISPDIIIREGERLINEIRSLGVQGLILFASLQIIAAVSGIFPASLLVVAAGAIYGISAGFLLSAITVMTGADLAFQLSRSLFRQSIFRWMSRHSKFRILEQLIAQDGWKLVCLLRISPVMPFSATSYLLGLSQISHRDYVLGTLASLPALFGYVLMGALTDAGLSVWMQGKSPIRMTLLVVGGIATIALTIRLIQGFIKLSLAAPMKDNDRVIADKE